MNKNYYDILQVNRNASSEIIEKAFKTLAKKYHPDLQAEENKKQAEEILKEINEAYEVLSNPEKKQVYDNLLMEQEKNNSSSFQNSESANDNDTFTQTAAQVSPEDLLYQQQQELLRQQKLQQEIDYQQQLQQAREKAYYDAYIQDLKNRGYKIRYRKSFKDYVKGMITILVVICALFLLWQIPFVHNYFLTLYEKNETIHSVVNLFTNIFR